MPRRIDHIGIAVRNLEEALAFYKTQLGIEPSGSEDLPSEGVRVAFLPVGDTELELLEPLGPDTNLAKSVEKRGPGLHHICFEVDDVAGELARLARDGVELIDATPRQGAGAKVGFVHPRASGGVLIELSEREGCGGR